MKIIDIERKGNVLRLYLGDDDLNNWYGDDWDDVPYEHNADPVYDKFVKNTIDIAFPFDYSIHEPKDDWHYNGNSPFCKDDFKTKVFMIIDKDPYWLDCYTKKSETGELLRITLGDKFDKKIFTNYGGVVL